jgi:hypothetical protein
VTAVARILGSAQQILAADDINTFIRAWLDVDDSGKRVRGRADTGPTE